MPIDLSNYAAILLDLDGTIYHVDHALPGAMDLIRRLQHDRKPYACLTNSTAGPRDLSRRLQTMGVDVDPHHIYSAAGAACDYVLEKYGAERPPRIFNLATDSVRDMLEGKVEWVNDADHPCDVVIVGTPNNPNATEDRRRDAMLLLRAGAHLVGTCADRVFPSRRGLEFGAGALSSMLAYAANVKPFFVGKPQPVFFQNLCRRLNVQPADCLLIGDNLESDIAGAKAVGMKTLLTLTGVARRQDIAEAPANQQPDAVIDDLTQLIP
jgi:HAD superfamily hydrolase (TIGR01450 family)